MKYRNEQDKSYGVAGMALGLSILDAQDLFTAINIDADPTECISFTAEYYFSGNPRLSARASWQYILQHFELSVRLAIANVLCRTLVGDYQLDEAQLRQHLLDAACDDGKEYCQLERDEVQPIFDKAYDYMRRVFGNSRVRDAIKQFVTLLQQRRTLSRSEVTDLLQQLHLI